MMQLEQKEQKALIKWFKLQYPKLANDIHHFANERKCSPQLGSKLKQMGVIAGVSDLFLGIPTQRYAGLWIELKVGAGKVSQAQQKFLSRKMEMGYLALSAWGFEAAKQIIVTYLKDFKQ